MSVVQLRAGAGSVTTRQGALAPLHHACQPSVVERSVVSSGSVPRPGCVCSHGARLPSPEMLCVAAGARGGAVRAAVHGWLHRWGSRLPQMADALPISGNHS